MTLTEYRAIKENIMNTKDVYYIAIYNQVGHEIVLTDVPKRFSFKECFIVYNNGTENLTIMPVSSIGQISLSINSGGKNERDKI